MAVSHLSRRRRVFATVLVLALTALPLRAETLADALIAAYRNSNLLEQNRAVLRAADEGVAIAVSALRPIISVSADATRTVSSTDTLNRRGRSVSIDTDTLESALNMTAQLTLYDFGRTPLAIEAAKEAVLATRESLVSLEQQVLLSAVSAYIDVRLNLEFLGLREANVRLITEELRAAQDRFDLGEVTRTDVALAEASLAQARSQLVVAQRDLMVAREDYRLAVGRYPGDLAAPPAAPRTARSLDEARSVAERTHPLVRQAQREVAIGELNVQRAQAEMRPTFSAQARVGRSVGESAKSSSSALSLNFNQTLYAGGQLSAAYRQAMANRDAARAALLQQTAEIGQFVGAAWANVSVAAAAIEATDREIRAAQTAFEGVREEASLGARTTLDVLDAEQDLLQARVNGVSAEANRYLSVYQLLAAMGLLTVEHLGLGIPTYDPAAYYNAVKSAPATSAQGKALDRVLKSIGKDGGN